MSLQPMKILVAGDVAGKYDQLFKRVRTVNKKAGPFEMLFCVGDFFGNSPSAQAEWKKYQDGEEKVPLPTFIVGPNKAEHLRFYKDTDGGDVAENVTYLGKKGVFTAASGLQIAYLSGTEQSEGSPVQEPHQFTKAHVDELGVPLVSDSKFHGVDILLTSQWPQGVSKYASPPEGINVEGLTSTGSTSLGDLALALRPRYHFAGLEGCYYERLPYRNHKILNEGAKHVTRFLALAKVGNAEKKKYLYAFNIIPMKQMDKEELVKQPQDVTECPFTWTQRKPQQPDMSNQYFYQTNQGQGQRDNKDRRDRKRSHDSNKMQRKPPKPTGPCWFCLASPQVEKHLVVSVGNSTYLALAKGGLVPDHVLITPIGHYQATVNLPEEVMAECEQYKSALRKMFKELGMACVIFERNFRTQHLQIQVVPFKFNSEIDLKDVFMEHAESKQLEINEIPRHSDLKQIVSVGPPYFYVELPNGDKLLHRVKKFFPLHFGREVMASPEILDMPERADWKACGANKEEETDMTAAFRKKFEKFDWNKDDDDED